MSGLPPLHHWILHLRLPFNLMLSPVFLWGVWLGGGVGDPLRLAAAFLSLHLFLAGGTNALNSYYDRDEGPIGGLLRPPPVDRRLLAWAWGVQVAGLPLAAWVGGPFLLAWLVLLAMATAYSHPRWRWKADPAAALAAVALGQGSLGALAGAWSVAARDRGWGVLLDVTSPDLLAGLAAAAFLIVGPYLVSQVYQTREDRRRGDRTLPVSLGPARALRLAVIASGVGGATLLVVTAGAPGFWSAAPALLVLPVVGVCQLRWAARFDEDDVPGNYRRAMALLAAGAAAMALFVVLLLVF